LRQPITTLYFFFFPIYLDPEQQGNRRLLSFFEKIQFLLLSQHYFTLILGDFNVVNWLRNNFLNYTIPSQRVSIPTLKS
jgi:hypothetical protein